MNLKLLEIQRKFPRLSELREACIENDNGSSYFRYGDDKLCNPLKIRFFEAIEADISQLDQVAWDILRQKLLQRANQKHPLRGWQQFFDTLNEAKGYLYLRRLGCRAIEFIPEQQNSRTPDMRATKDGRVVLCEVKTINVSDFEAKRLTEGTVASTQRILPAQFMKKLFSTISNASAQIQSYKEALEDMGVALVCINFDDHLHEYVDDYREQIAACLASRQDYGVLIALDINPQFHSAV